MAEYAGQKVKIAVIGRTRYLYDSIEPLLSAGHEIAAIITCLESPEYDITADDFKKLALRLNIPFLFAERINNSDAIYWMKKHSADVAVSMNWKTLIKKPFRNIFEHGVINIHLGDLPKYRGNATPNWAIINGENKVVLTLHLMVDDLDAGPILMQKNIPISDETYIGSVYSDAGNAIPQLLVDTLSQMQIGTLVPRPQSEKSSHALRCYPRIPGDSKIEWTLPATEIARLIRASAEPFAGAYTYLNCKKLIIWRARQISPGCPYLGIPGQIAEIDRDSGQVRVITGNGFLALELIELEDSGKCIACDIIKSSRTRLGMDISAEINRLNKKLEEMESEQESTHNRLRYQL